jgi:hypothetical protein
MRHRYRQESSLRSAASLPERSGRVSARTARAPIGNQAMQRMLANGDLQRQPATPTYRDCSESITGRSDANEILDAAITRARDYLDVAIAAMGRTPVAGSVMETALARHFISPTATQRSAIEDNYRLMRRELRVNNFICNNGSLCDGFQAFWLESDDLLHICPMFWGLNRTCQAIVLIHETAHDVDVDAALPGHPMNRGTATYPAGNNPPPDGETTVNRMQNPDAYAFFAAHIWRSTDTGSRCGT